MTQSRYKPSILGGMYRWLLIYFGYLNPPCSGFFRCVVPEVWKTGVKFFIELGVEGIVYTFLSAGLCGGWP